MSLGIYFLLPLAALCDMCADFCVQKLGRGGNGSYCKTNGYCHSLFWTNETSICLFTGGRQPDDCQDNNPVSCNDASNHLLSLSPLPVDIIDMIPTRRLINDHRPHVRIEYQTQSSGLAFVALFDTSSVYSLVPVVGELNPYVVYASMHDSLSFDRIRNISVRAARTRQRYIDSNRAPVLHAGLDMNFGSPNQSESCRVIRESARLHSVFNHTFSFDVDTVLTRDSVPYFFVLAGGKDSDFAHAAGVFGIASNQLVIGPGTREYILRNFCTQSRFRWISSEQNDWIINGTMGPTNVRFLFDTAEDRDGYSVPGEFFTNVVETLVSLGALPTSSESFSNCSRSILQSFPSIQYGIQTSQLIIQPEEYVEFAPSGVGCRLRLYSEDSNIVTLGDKALVSLAVVFDDINSRIGLCFTD